jgi:hypothetical protein
MKVHGADVNILNNQDCPPIHLAIQADHYFMLELLMTCKFSSSDFDLLKLLEFFLTCGAIVNVSNVGETTCSIAISLIAAKVGEKILNEAIKKVNVSWRSKENYAWIYSYWHLFFYRNKGPNRDEEIFKVLDLFFKHHPKMPSTLELPEDRKFGSLLHYFAAVNDAGVIKKLVSEPIGYPPDLENAAGYTSLLVALDNGHEDTILQLLEYNVNVNKMDPLTKLTPLQLLCKKEFQDSPRWGEIIDKLLEKGIYF